MKKILCALSAILFISGCSGKNIDTDNKFTIYTSFYTMQSFTEMIAGDKAEVFTLIAPGVEVHTWEPDTTDMVEFSRADVFVYSGMEMEPWAEKILSGMDNNKLVVVEASRGVEGIKNYGNADPHIWLDPENAIIELENIASAIIAADEENAEYYRANLENARTKMKELDGEFADAAARFSDKEIIVTHGAFGYLCNAYGLSQYMIEGLSGESDPSSTAISDAIERLKNKPKKAIFYVKSEGDKLASVISEETGAAVYALNPFESDAEGKDYFEVMRENLTVLKDALYE